MQPAAAAPPKRRQVYPAVLRGIIDVSGEGGLPAVRKRPYQKPVRLADLPRPLEFALLPGSFAAETLHLCAFAFEHHLDAVFRVRGFRRVTHARIPERK